MLSEDVKTVLLGSESSKAFATTGDSGLNNVPVSSIELVDANIWLFDYFFNKTKENLAKGSSASLVAWTGFVGYQVKGAAKYVSSGDDFEKAKEWVLKRHPERILNGLVILTPTEVHDISITDKI